MKREPAWFADTNIVFHVLRQTPLGAHLVRAMQFRARPSTPLISVVTQAELYSLAAMNNHGAAKRSRLEELLSELVIVDVNSRPIIDRYAELDVASHRLGKSKVSRHSVRKAKARSAERAQLVFSLSTAVGWPDGSMLRTWRTRRESAQGAPCSIATACSSRWRPA